MIVHFVPSKVFRPAFDYVLKMKKGSFGFTAAIISARFIRHQPLDVVSTKSSLITTYMYEMSKQFEEWWMLDFAH
jgi:hypothetical protein